MTREELLAILDEKVRLAAHEAAHRLSNKYGLPTAVYRTGRPEGDDVRIYLKATGSALLVANLARILFGGLAMAPHAVAIPIYDANKNAGVVTIAYGFDAELDDNSFGASAWAGVRTGASFGAVGLVFPTATETAPAAAVDEELGRKCSNAIERGASFVHHNGLEIPIVEMAGVPTGSFTVARVGTGLICYAPPKT